MDYLFWIFVGVCLILWLQLVRFFWVFLLCRKDHNADIKSEIGALRHELFFSESTHAEIVEKNTSCILEKLDDFNHQLLDLNIRLQVMEEKLTYAYCNLQRFVSQGEPEPYQFQFLREACAEYNEKEITPKKPTFDRSKHMKEIHKKKKQKQLTAKKPDNA